MTLDGTNQILAPLARGQGLRTAHERGQEARAINRAELSGRRWVWPVEPTQFHHR